ncbi:MAG: hypothetical protein ABSB15_19835 [Bryobacteraceae bacterium]|jgi:predicted nuclease with TOPRIM domain
MAEGNGHQDNVSRLDRIEAAMEHMVDEHEAFRAEHKMLLRSQVLLQGSLEDLKDRVGEIGDKLDGLIGVVDHDHREFHERLQRLEEKQ